MSIAEAIKQARERQGLTQEDLAEKLEVSRQAVSKWELGASVPSAENLKLLEDVLGERFQAEEAAETPKAPAASRKVWKIAALGGLMLAAALSIAIYLIPDTPDGPKITGISFFDENASPLQPDLGDGWNQFTPGERVLMVVEFQEGRKRGADAVSLFLTPTGTETFDQRQQLGVQAIYDGRRFALFALDVPEGLTGHLEVVLEAGDQYRDIHELNVTSFQPDAPPALEDGKLTIPDRVDLDVGGPYAMLLADGAPFAEVEWSVSDPGVAEVSSTGAVFPVSPGEAVITALWNGQSAVCVVTVTAG